MDWPMAITPASGRWRLLGGARSGGRAFAGTEQVIVVAGVVWRPALPDPLVRTDKKS
ncbi:hypothetical protein [Methylobacterium fujisawaense]